MSYSQVRLPSKKTINLSKKVSVIINNELVEFYSGTPCIINSSFNSHLILNTRWVSYYLDENGKKKSYSPTKMTLNSLLLIDNKLLKCSSERFFDIDLASHQNCYYKGFEDLRLFNFQGQLYYLASVYDNSKQSIQISSDKYFPDKNKLTKNIIYPDFKKPFQAEKNWSFCQVKDKLLVIYSWYPLKVCTIDYSKRILKLLWERKMPKPFMNYRGSTCGIQIGDEIWFIIHTKRTFYHSFIIFDINLNLIKSSQLFKFQNFRIEYCLGFVFLNNQLIISYSCLDRKRFISIYELKDIQNNLKWYFKDTKKN